MENYKKIIEQCLLDSNNEVIETNEQLESYRIKYLSSNGLLKKLFQDMKQVRASDRKEAGTLLGQLKESLEYNYEKNLK